MIVFIVQVFMLSIFMEHWAQAQEHVGCFRSTNGQPILSKPFLIPGQDEKTITIDICIMRCRTKLGTTYAGIRRGFYCRCGDSHYHEVNGPQLSDSSCATECPGDPQRNCGGDSSMVIYSVCNQTRYRDITNARGNCDASCHCMDLQACTYSSGLCPAGCEPGWSSAACNVREFTAVAGDQTLMTDAVDRSVGTGMTVHPTITLVSASGAESDGRTDQHTNDNIPVTVHPTITLVSAPGADQDSRTDQHTNDNIPVTVHPTITLVSASGTDPDGRIDPHTNDNIRVTAIAVGVSVAFICLVALAALIVYIRKRGHTRKFDDSPVEAVSIPEVTVGDIHNKDDLAMEQPDNGEPSSSSPALNYSPVVFENHSPPRDDGKEIAKSDDDIVIHDDQEKVEYAVCMRPAVTEFSNLKENSLYGTYSEDMDGNNFE